MLHFLRALKWVYVNVVYTIGPYGENAVKQLNLKAEAFGICIEVLHMVIKIDERAMDDAVKKLQRHQKAKVVIGFFEHGGDLFEEAILKRHAEKDFIFLGSDTVYFNFNGVFRVQPVRTIHGSFYSRMEEFFYQRDVKYYQRILGFETSMLTNTTVLGIVQRQKIPAIPLNLINQSWNFQFLKPSKTENI